MQLGLDLRDNALLDTLAADITKSSEIEGEILNRDQVRSSVARHLGIETEGLPEADRYVEGVVQVIVLKVAVTYLWFVPIHPFDDGNGCIARTITNLLLACVDEMSHCFYSMLAELRKQLKLIMKYWKDPERDSGHYRLAGMVFGLFGSSFA